MAKGCLCREDGKVTEGAMVKQGRGKKAESEQRKEEKEQKQILYEKY